MSARKLRGFTLIELLVVIVIISVLVGLMIPAVLSSRESARRNNCINNQHEIAVALQQYEAATERMPAYSTTFGSAPTPLTWVAMISPHMGLNDVWSLLRAGNAPGVPTSDSRLICPSDGSKVNSLNYPLSYAANCGWTDGSTLTTLQATFVEPGATQVVRSEAIPDGAQNTLMFSENLNATQWYPVDAPKGTAARTPYIVDVGIVWRSQPLGQLAINAGLNSLPDMADSSIFPADDTRALNYLSYARPSSYHPGGVVATYFDGHTDFLADSIGALAYQQLMSPNDTQAKDTNFHTPPLIP